jgi:arginase
MRIAIFAVPYDAGHRSVGVGLGPARLLEAGFANHLREAGHDVAEWTVEMPDDTPSHELARIAAIQRELARGVRAAVERDELPVVLAGNCSTAVGTLAARPDSTIVVWFDAHGDFNTAETTTTGMVDGLALSMLTGRALRNLTASVDGFIPVDERRVILVGARDLDPPEEEAFRSSPIQRLSATGAPTSIHDAIRKCAEPGSPAYIHLDLDVLDPADARANQYASPGGLSPTALIRTLEAVAAVTHVYALAITAYDPSYDLDGRTRRAAIEAVSALVPRPEVAD